MLFTRSGTCNRYEHSLWKNYYRYNELLKLQNYLMKKFVKESASISRQFLNGQEVRRISGLQKVQVRFGSFCGKGTDVCEPSAKREEGMCCP